MALRYTGSLVIRWNRHISPQIGASTGRARLIAGNMPIIGWPHTVGLAGDATLIGTATTKGYISGVAIHATAYGRSTTKGNSSVPVSLKGTVTTTGTTLLLLTAKGGAGLVQAQGKINASLGVKALGQSKAQGSATALVHISATAIGTTKAQGYFPGFSISVSATGVATAVGSIVPLISATTIGCMSGDDVPGSPKPLNRAY